MKSKLQSLRRLAQENAARVSVAAVTLGASVAALADPTDPFTDAVTAATAKIGTYGAALVGIAAVGVLFMIGAKYVKKISRVA